MCSYDINEENITIENDLLNGFTIIKFQYDSSCYDNMDNDNLSKSEFYARKQMIEMCINIANQHDDIIEQEFLEDDFEEDGE